MVDCTREGARLRSKAHEWTLLEEMRIREEMDRQWAARVKWLSTFFEIVHREKKRK